MKNITKINSVAVSVSPPPVDLSNPGVLKRGVIVFGGFALLAVAYFLFYRGKNVKNENLNIHNTTDGPQFRYGVLQSDDKKDNLSRMPLTMESDEDEEDDLEVFDIEQKKKSLSYVNLQSHMEDIDNFSSPADNPLNDNERNTLLLDIDDRIPDNLINLTNSNHKSIL
ncbi:hypothetical protein EVAR_100986_1 [Eumeta japonica]|uniref:Uncharacterized protein n=1 Tax=Eumeta variegata TaxID=151549 RepID=A0A4C1SMP3_EUMVA|nr:hypothetical protein EVAR_100986_1 [Eumeta japonica]